MARTFLKRNAVYFKGNEDNIVIVLSMNKLCIK